MPRSMPFVSADIITRYLLSRVGITCFRIRTFNGKPRYINLFLNDEPQATFTGTTYEELVNFVYENLATLKPSLLQDAITKPQD